MATPLLRIQLDSLIRLSYVASAPNAEEVAKYVIGGGEFRKLKDANDRLLTDARLLEHAKEPHLWIQGVYKATSGWVHFSPAHILAAWEFQAEGSLDSVNDGRRLFGSVPMPPERIPLAILQELLGAMIKATEQIFGYVEAWESRKGLPSGQIREL